MGRARIGTALSYNGLTPVSTPEGSEVERPSPHRNYSEGGWPDHGHSHPSRNYNAELSVTKMLQGRSIIATGTVHSRASTQFSLPRFSHNAWVDPGNRETLFPEVPRAGIEPETSDYQTSDPLASHTPCTCSLVLTSHTPQLAKGQLGVPPR